MLNNYFLVPFLLRKESSSFQQAETNQEYKNPWVQLNNYSLCGTCILSFTHFKLELCLNEHTVYLKRTKTKDKTRPFSHHYSLEKCHCSWVTCDPQGYQVSTKLPAEERKSVSTSVFSIKILWSRRLHQMQLYPLT